MVEAIFKDAAPEAFAIVTKESGWNPTAISPTEDYGLFQINKVHANRVEGDVDKLLDPETNIEVAYEIYKEQSWCPWNVDIGQAVSCHIKPSGVVAGLTVTVTP